LLQWAISAATTVACLHSMRSMAKGCSRNEWAEEIIGSRSAFHRKAGGPAFAFGSVAPFCSSERLAATGAYHRCRRAWFPIDTEIQYRHLCAEDIATL
jgi:hypothetical protein